ncbi:MAG TPA: hypothetical protein VF098_09135 [Sphingomicrobium sp.]
MLRQTFQLLVFLTVLAVAPAAAGQRLSAARHGSGCPHDAARAAAAANAFRAATAHARNWRNAQKSGGGTIILFDHIPSDGSPLGIGRASGVFMP